MSLTPPARNRGKTGRRGAGPPLPTRAEAWGLALVVLSGVALLPGALNRYVFPKWAVAAVGIATALRGPGRGRLPTPVLVLLGAGLSALAAAALLGADPIAQTIGMAPRYEGLPGILLYVAAGATGARLLGPGRHPDQDVLLVRILAGAALAVALVAVVETTGLAWWESDVSRPGSLLGNASDQGAWAVLALGPLLLAGVRAPDRWSMAGTFAAALAVVLSASRGALLGAAVVLALSLLAEAGRRSRLLVLGVAALMAMAALAPLGVRDRLAGEGLAGRTAAGRGELWSESVDLWSEHPLFGVGPGGFGAAVRGVLDSSWYAQMGPDFPPDSPHSWPLQALLAGGPVLLSSVLGLVALLARSAYRTFRTDPQLAALGVGLAGYGTALLFHFTGPGHTPLAALFAGALLAVPVDRSLPSRPGPASRAASLTAAVVAVICLLGAAAEVPLRQAVVAVAVGDVEAAEEHFAATEALRGWDVAVAATAGHAYRVVGVSSGDPVLLEEGERWLSGIPEDRRSVTALADLAAVRERSGDLGGAVVLLDEALRRDAANPETLLLRGVVAAQQGDVEVAERMFQEASRSAPANPAPWENLAQLYRSTNRQGDAAEAEARADELR